MGYLNPVYTASGVTFGAWQQLGAVGHIEQLITVNNVAKSAPATVPSVSSAGGGTYGGALLAGTVYGMFTEVDTLGETTASPEFGPITLTAQAAGVTAATASVGSNSVGTLPAGGYKVQYTYIDAATGGEGTAGTTESAYFTVVLGNTPTITAPTLPVYASFWNLYATMANGSTGSEVLYAKGLTAATYAMASSAYANTTQTPPTTNGLSTNIPLLTFPALQTGNVARDVYLTASTGQTGSETYYAGGITAGTFSLSAALNDPVGVNFGPPVGNSTGLTTAKLQLIRALKRNNFNYVAHYVSDTIRNFNQGSPVSTTDIQEKFRNCAVMFGMFATMMNEASVLLAANPGHVVNQPNGIGQQRLKRVWP